MAASEKMTDEQLIASLRAGESEITDFIMEKYKYLVRKKAKAMFLLGGENDDLIQEGMIGLFKAVRDYRPALETYLQALQICRFQTDVGHRGIKTKEAYPAEPLCFSLRGGRSVKRGRLNIPV